MTRPSFEHINMQYAWLLSRRSTCARLQVGCVITSIDFRKVISIGYNGGAAGQKNECESLEPGQCGHLHAEDNAVINCDAPRGTEKIVFCTDLPCAMCAKRFVNLGDVLCVYYDRDYRVRDGIDILDRANIAVRQMNVESSTDSRSTLEAVAEYVKMTHAMSSDIVTMSHPDAVAISRQYRTSLYALTELGRAFISEDGLVHIGTVEAIKNLKENL